MSNLFRRPKATPVATAPDPRDEAAREQTELARRAGQKRGKSSTILSRMMRPVAVDSQAAPAKTLNVGG